MELQRYPAFFCLIKRKVRYEKDKKSFLKVKR